MTPRGYTDGDVCGRALCSTMADGWPLFCDGVIKMHASENCSCHIAPPCWSCTEVTAFCPACGWEESDDPLCVHAVNTYRLDSSGFVYAERTRRVLDPTKIDYITTMHSSSSQKVTGVYPPGITQDQVRAVVKGTFGGRFSKFADGHFVFIAYTD